MKGHHVTGKGRKEMALLFFGTVAWALLVALAWTGGAGAETAGIAATNPFSGNAEAIDRGQELFEEYCSECHGSGTGGRGPNLIDEEWLYGGSDADLFKSISDGRPGGMPAMSFDISKEEIWKVMAFLRSLAQK